MYRVSPFVRHFAWALLGGALIASLWVNLDPGSYYDAIELRLFDLHFPVWLSPFPVSLTPLALVSHGLMALFMFFVGKELWEAMVLERGAFTGGNAAVPMGGIIGGMVGATILWVVFQTMFETAAESTFGLGWPVPLGSDVVLGYLVGRAVFGSGHPALHVLLLVLIGADIFGLLLAGLANPEGLLRLGWLALPLLASYGCWRIFGRRPDPDASERSRRRGLRLWPYIVAGGVSFIGVAAAGLPPALGLLPVIPAIPHAERSFGLFAEAEELLHDPLNRLAHFLIHPLAVVLFLFGLTNGGIDLDATAAATGSVLAAMWIGKPLGLLAGMAIAARIARATLPPGIGLRDVILIAVIVGMGFTVPVLALETALPGGGMTEAARLGLAFSLLAGPAAMVLARILPDR